jgi:hypothetical protein
MRRSNRSSRFGVIRAALCNVAIALRFEVDRGFEAAIHVEWYRAVLMRDFPLAVDLAKAEGLAKPEVDLFTLSRRRHHSIQAVAETDVVAGRDFEVSIS